MEEKNGLKQFFEFIKIIIEFIIFLGAIFFIHKEIGRYSLGELQYSFKAISFFRIFLIICFVLLDYLVLSGFDILAFKKDKYSFSKIKIMFTSFISFGLSNSIGFSGFTASGVRLNLYSLWDIPYKTIINVIIFCYSTYWLGLLWLGGGLLTLLPVNLTVLKLPFHIPIKNTVSIGIFLLIGAIIFTLVVLKKYSESLEIYLYRLTLAIADWISISLILYLALPDSLHISFMFFFPIFVTAQILGVVSNVPGGLGVFDLTFIALIGSNYPVNKIIGAILIYRLAYFFIPLLLALLGFILCNIIFGKNKLKDFDSNVGRYIFSLFPKLLALLIFISGAFLIFSGSIPAKIQAINSVQEYFPIVTIQFSHFIGSIVGAGLLILSYGLSKRIDISYYLTLIFLALGIVVSLIKDLDTNSAIGLGVIFLIILPCKSYFYRKSSILREKFSIKWIMLVISTIVLGIYIGLFSHKNALFVYDTFWRFNIYDETPKFARGILGAILVFCCFFLVKFIFKEPNNEILTPEDFETNLRNCIEKSSNTTGYLALLKDKQIIFDPDKKSFIMFGRSGDSLISMGEPIGDEESFGETIWTFYNYCKEQHKNIVFYEIGNKNLDFYLDIGLSFLKIGEYAVVNLSTFTLEGSEMRKLRYTYSKFTKDGYVLEIIPKEKVSEILNELKEISDEWLDDKNSKEKGFSLGKFSNPYLLNFPVAVVKKDNKILAFSNLLTTQNKEEFTIDLMRYTKEAPNGIMEYCFICIMLYAKEEGFKRFTLGMAPLSGIDSDSASFWNKVENMVFTHGEYFYNFKGLRAFKDKFKPEWEPRYIAYSNPFSLPKVLRDTTLLISGGVKGLVSKK
ncbi:MAG: bifunctional lysylphosphatidylglycerol flippase/synthetase MprF [Cetobacterium sp.]|uniref:bifunctional lysylphosphatidylglycerol flippase/synthetase MprF n=1 Tax=unclassified Cetobacterium TaxID=2630983 RepID=UPI00163C9971|nr:bifunctional lysylphosphatidylglycerol flippase/synthetase MprF [Cetobacterium sp. 2A]